MRQIIFKEKNALDKKRRYLYIQDVLPKGGYVYTAERKSIFGLKEISSFKDAAEAHEWISKRLTDSRNLRRLSILKTHDTKSGERLWQTKLADSFYIMRKNTVLTISFIEVFKVAKDKKV